MESPKAAFEQLKAAFKKASPQIAEDQVINPTEFYELMYLILSESLATSLGITGDHFFHETLQKAIIRGFDYRGLINELEKRR